MNFMLTRFYLDLIDHLVIKIKRLLSEILRYFP